MMYHSYEGDLEKLSILCESELITQNLYDEISISQNDLKDEILHRFLDDRLNTDEDALGEEVKRLVKSIVNHKRYYGLGNKEEEKGRLRVGLVRKEEVA